MLFRIREGVYGEGEFIDTGQGDFGWRGNCSSGMELEIEAGKSNAAWNVRQDLLMGWKVIVVATSEEAKRRVERELAREDLIGTGKVELVLRDRLIKMPEA